MNQLGDKVTDFEQHSLKEKIAFAKFAVPGFTTSDLGVANRIQSGREISAEIRNKIESGEFSVNVQPTGAVVIRVSDVEFPVGYRLLREMRQNTYAMRALLFRREQKGRRFAERLRLIESIDYDSTIVPCAAEMQGIISHNSDLELVSIGKNWGAVQYLPEFGIRFGMFYFFLQTYHHNFPENVCPDDHSKLLIHFEVHDLDGEAYFISQGYGGKKFEDVFFRGLTSILKSFHERDQRRNALAYFQRDRSV